jgi:tRNA1Val (adenine37-N6)-methyltransferase
MSQPFKFKQFEVFDDRSPMKVGTDSILLGAWTGTEGAERILDIGTGCGILALMLAQKSNAQIDAVDIDQGAVEQAQVNFRNSPWAAQLRSHQVSFQDFSENSEMEYGLIVSNPPYFDEKNALVSSTKSGAKHTFNLSHPILIQGVKKLLKADGSFCVILPKVEGDLFLQSAFKEGLYCTKKTAVKPVQNKPPNRLLLEFRFHNQILDENELVIWERPGKEYAPAFKKLTEAYYQH